MCVCVCARVVVVGGGDLTLAHCHDQYSPRSLLCVCACVVSVVSVLTHIFGTYS